MKGSQKDPITGNWQIVGNSYADPIKIKVKSGNSKHKTYFALVTNGRGRKTWYDGYADTNKNGRYDKTDRFVGDATSRSLDGVPYYSGTFSYSDGRFESYQGNRLVATGEGYGDWFF